jgi:hypothetical protein
MTALGRIYWLRLGLRWLAVAAAAWLLAGLFAWLAGGHLGAREPGPLPASFSTGGPGWPAAPAAAVVLPALLLAGLALAALRLRSRDRLRRDPRRQFSREQCREGLARAGGICELETTRRHRCTRPAMHGTHFFPWSAGGSTTMANFVAVCGRCKRFRKAHFPSPGAQHRLEERRRGYFPPGAAVTAGERNPVSGRAPAWLSG